MIQFNLLPDVKLEYIKAQRARRLAMSAALIASAAAIALLIVLFGVGKLQQKHLSDLSDDITEKTNQLNREKDISKVLTVQNQLTSLPGLHDTKTASSRAYIYFSQLTPPEVEITSLSVDMDELKISISGSATDLKNVNKYVDIFKYTQFRTDTNKEPQPAFKDVVLASFGISSEKSETGKPATYSIDFLFDKAIFDVTQKPVLVVPDRVTTGVITQGGN